MFVSSLRALLAAGANEYVLGSGGSRALGTVLSEASVAGGQSLGILCLKVFSCQPDAPGSGSGGCGEAQSWWGESRPSLEGETHPGVWESWGSRERESPVRTSSCPLSHPGSAPWQIKLGGSCWAEHSAWKVSGEALYSWVEPGTLQVHWKHGRTTALAGGFLPPSSRLLS